MTLAPLPIDWNEVTDEATSLLQDYIRINTTNPPGGEEAGAIFLRDALARDGIASTLYDAGKGRVSISARVAGRGGGNAKPIVLLSHIDVVPAEPEHWQVDPFSGRLVENVVWGRGALDMKGMGIMELMILALIQRHRLELDRDIVFLAVADEEEGGAHGAKWLQKEHPELFDAAAVFNEGAYGFCEFMGQKVTMFGMCPTEKSPCWITLSVTGAPGHGSVPHGNNALARLVKALARIEAREQHARLTPAVEAMLRTVKQRGLVPEEIDPLDPATLEMITSVDAHLSALTRDTISITGAHGGQKHNVIPTLAEATLDCRLLPDTDPDTFVRELAGVIGDPGIEIRRVMEHYSGESSMDTPVVSAITAAIAERYGDDATMLPMLSPGFTDSHAFRSAGVPAYGFTPTLLTREELATIHGHNERISTANLRLGTEILFDVVRRLAAAPA
jgi:acetylornithine deacetylase/succinyl-diaminopimelate desuccinylase-like protein